MTLFDRSAKRKSIASTVRTTAASGLSRSTTHARPDFIQFPRFPLPVPSASPSSPHTPHKKARRKGPTRALSEWGWGLDFGAGRSGPSEGETTAAAAADVLVDVEMLDGRPPSRRARSRAKARGKDDGTPVRGPASARRNGLPELQMVAREQDSDDDELSAPSDSLEAHTLVEGRLTGVSPRLLLRRSALADSPSRQRLLFGAPPAASVQHAPANPLPQRLVTAPKLVLNPSPRAFELRSAPLIPTDDGASANQSEEVVELRTTGRPSGAQSERSSMIAEPDSVAGRSAAPGPLRSSSSRPAPKTSTIVASTSPIVSTPTQTRRASNGASARPLSDLVDSLMSVPHTTAVRARSGRSRVEGIPVWRGASSRGLEFVSTDVRSWSAGGGAGEERSETVVAEGTSLVAAPRSTSEPFIDDPSSSARAPARPTVADTTIDDDSSASVPGSRRQVASEAPAEILVPASSTESLEGGMSLMPDDDGSQDVPMLDLDEPDPEAQGGLQLPATRPSGGRQSTSPGSDGGLGTLLDAPLILALSSDEPRAPPPRPLSAPSMLPAAMQLGQDERWQHLTLSQASAAAERSPPGVPVPSARAFRALPADFRAPSTGRATTTSAFTYRLEASASVAVPARAPPSPPAQPARPPDRWPLGDGMVGLTDMLEYEREFFAGDPTRDDMDLDLDLDGSTDDEQIAAVPRAGAPIEGEAAQSPPTSEDAPFVFAGPPSPSGSLPSLHFVSSASAAPSTPPPTLPLLPQPQDDPPARKTKGILRSSSPLTEVESDKTARAKSARSCRSKTVTFAPDGDESEGAAPSKRGRSGASLAFIQLSRTPTGCPTRAPSSDSSSASASGSSHPPLAQQPRLCSPCRLQPARARVAARHPVLPGPLDHRLGRPGDVHLGHAPQHPRQRGRHPPTHVRTAGQPARRLAGVAAAARTPPAHPPPRPSRLYPFPALL